MKIMKTTRHLMEIRLLAALLLALPATVQAQFTFTTNADNTLTIAGYTGSGGAVTIPSTFNSLPVTGIGDHAFNGVGSLTSVTIGTNVTSIGAGPFSDCIFLNSITVDPGNPAYVSVAGILFNSEQTALIQYPPHKSGTSYHIPNSVITVGNNAFSESDYLTSITIGTNVASIGGAAFFLTMLTTIAIPASVTNIGDYAFEDDAFLTNGIYFKGNAPTCGTFTFETHSGGNTIAYYYAGTSGWDPVFNEFYRIPSVMLDAPNPNGSLAVSISPMDAMTAGAQWQVDYGVPQPSGATVLGLSVGNHTVSFTAVAGWVAPTNQMVYVSANSTATAGGDYLVAPPLSDAILTVSTNGVGALNPNYNGASLQVGSRFAITATAGTGFVFSNWTGGANLPLNVLTNGRTVQFVMASNLMLQANFVDTNKPAINITNVPAGLRVSNAVFVVKGTASDNWQVTNVFYSLNTGGWSNAVTSNNWSNWTAAVTLMPGTNMIAVYAVDPAGNVSTTKTVSVVYILSAPLTVGINGEGTISPNYNNALLQLGASYSMTAKAATGSSFTNWTDGFGNVITNRATLRFTMASNLVLVANFVDTNPPTCKFIAPTTSSARLTNGLVTVQVRATDNVGVTNVEFAMNGRYFGPGFSGSSNLWTMNFALAAGTNTITAVAADFAGNTSKPASIKLIYVNVQTNANVITLAEHCKLFPFPGPPGFYDGLIQDAGLLNAALTVPGLRTMSSDTWSNLFISLSFQNLKLEESLSQADVLTTNQAIFSILDPFDPGATPDYAETISLLRLGNALVITARISTPTRLLEAFQPPTLTSYCEISFDGWPPIAGQIQDQQPFNLLLQDGETGDTYANITQTIYVTGNANWQNAQVSGAADFTPPTITITAPVNGQRWSNSAFNVTGTARDNEQVSNVWVQVNSTGWQLADTTNNWTNWMSGVALTPGTNTVQAYAVDASGNVSKTNRVNVVYVKMFNLADYYPLPLGAEWLYAGTDYNGNPVIARYQVINTNYSLTLYTGGNPSRSYHTNCVDLAAAYLDPGTLATNDSWDEYWISGPRLGSYGDDDLPTESVRWDGGIKFPAQMGVGASASVSASAYSFGVKIGTTSVTLQLLENTSITLPAGYFPDVLHFRMTSSTTGEATQEKDWWWARSVGLIKRQGISNDNAFLGTEQLFHAVFAGRCDW